MIIVSANIKGGPGKSCVSQNLAVYLQKEKGWRILLVDADPQETTAEWLAERRKAGIYDDIRFSKMTGDIRDDLIDQAGNYDAVVVDSGGHNSEAMLSAMAAADIVIIPFRPKRRDLKLLPKMAKLVKMIKAVKPSVSCRAVINQARSLPSQISRAVDAKKACAAFDLNPIETILYDRNIYDDADESGGSIFEVNNDAKAKQEFSSVIEELLSEESK